MASSSQKIFIVVSLVVMFGGCEVPTFSNSLVDPADAEVPEDLLGSYRSISDEEGGSEEEGDELYKPDPLDEDDFQYVSFEHIGLAGDDFPPGFVRIVSVDIPDQPKGKIEHSSFVGFTAQMGENYVLHIPLPRNTEQLSKADSLYEKKWNPENFDGYMLVFLKSTKAGFELWEIDSTFVISEIESGRLAGEYQSAARKQDKDETQEEDSRSPVFRVTADRDSLRRFFAEQVDRRLLKKAPLSTYERIK